METIRKRASATRTSPRKANKELVLKALTDPKFRKLLAADPTKALGKRRLTDIQKREIELVLASVKGIELQLNIMADKLLCACGVIV